MMNAYKHQDSVVRLLWACLWILGGTKYNQRSGTHDARDGDVGVCRFFHRWYCRCLSDFKHCQRHFQIRSQHWRHGWLSRFRSDMVYFGETCVGMAVHWTEWNLEPRRIGNYRLGCIPIQEHHWQMAYYNREK